MYREKIEKITLQIVSAVAVVKHLFHEYYPYWTARRRNRSVHKLTKHIACLTRIYTSAQRWLNSIQLVFFTLSFATFRRCVDVVWFSFILFSNWLPASSSPIEIFILSARSYTEVHSDFFLCCLFVWWCVSSLFIHLCSYARVYKPCTQFRTANSSTTSCPCLCIHIYSNHLHTYTNNELRSVFLSLSAFLSFTLFIRY